MRQFPLGRMLNPNEMQDFVRLRFFPVRVGMSATACSGQCANWVVVGRIQRVPIHDDLFKCQSDLCRQQQPLSATVTVDNQTRGPQPATMV